jgi:hypothetical protein
LKLVGVLRGTRRDLGGGRVLLTGPPPPGPGGGGGAGGGAGGGGGGAAGARGGLGGGGAPSARTTPPLSLPRFLPGPPRVTLGPRPACPPTFWGILVGRGPQLRKSACGGKVVRERGGDKSPRNLPRPLFPRRGSNPRLSGTPGG